MSPLNLPSQAAYPRAFHVTMYANELHVQGARARVRNHLPRVRWRHLATAHRIHTMNHLSVPRPDASAISAQSAWLGQGLRLGIISLDDATGAG